MNNEAKKMATELKLPELGENIDSGQVVRVLVAVGDRIAHEQPVIEIETGKASVEVPAPEAGRVSAVLVRPGDTLKVGQVFLMLEEDNVKLTPTKALEIAESPEAPPPPPAKQERAEAPKAPKSTEERPAFVPASAPKAGGAGFAIAAPHVRQFAREIGVEVDEVVGSGPGGRVSTEDVKRHARELKPRGGAGAAGIAARRTVKLPDFASFGPIDREALPTVRLRIAEQMALSWETIPHVALQAKADITDLEAFRQKFKDRVERAGGKLTMTAILVKVVAAALKAFPKFNASLDLEKHEVVLKRYVHLGIATDTPKGLLVPVIRDADKKSLVQLGIELTELSKKAREGKLAPNEMQGASFTVTNLGGMGIGHFSAVVNAPEAAILAIGKAEYVPVWNGKSFEPRLQLPLTLNIDHRVLDGADGARFLSWIVQGIEQPLLVVLES